MSRGGGGRVGLVVPLVASLGELDREGFTAALERVPDLELVITGTADQRARLEPGLSAWLAAQPRVRFVELSGSRAESALVQAGMVRVLGEGYPFVGYWAPDCEVDPTLVVEWRRRLEQEGALLIFGSRLRLVQSKPPGSWLRHYAGRVHASIVSLVLRLGIYDTDCCAKLFRNTEVTRAVFADPFETSVCFDVELFVRLLAQAAARPELDIGRDCIEAPVQTWRRHAQPRYGLANAGRVANDLLLLRARMREIATRPAR